MSKTAKKWIFAVLRLVVCAAALGWVLHNLTFYDHVTLADGGRHRGAVEVHVDHITIVATDGTTTNVPLEQVALDADGTLQVEYGLRSTWQRATKQELFVCLLIFAPVPLIQSLRFRWMLRAQEIEVSYFECVKLSVAGNFLNFITLLGTTGGDVFKAYFVSLHTKRKTEAVMTVLLDRIVGLYALAILLAAILIVRMGDSKLYVLLYGIAVLVLGGVIAGVILFSQRVRALVNPTHLLGKLPFASHLQRAEAATRRLAHHKPLVIGAMGCTIVLQFIGLTSYVLAAKAVGMRWDGQAIWDYYACIAGGIFVAAIPISPQGLGTMEAFYKYILLDTHGTLAALLCLAMVVRAIQLFWALPGVLVTMTGSYRPRENMAALEDPR